MKSTLTNNEEDQIEEQYRRLKDLVWEECHVPVFFFQKSSLQEKCCFFMFSNSLCNFLFIDDNYQSFTGYSPGEHKKGGLDFWFSKIHPNDRRMLADRIFETQKKQRTVINKEDPTPVIINYRFIKGNEEWIWIQHTVYILSFDNNGGIEKMLHKLVLLDKLAFPENLEKKPFEISLNESGQQEGIDKLTKREKQVLKLIAEGFSSKVIADQLKISINTVETHRRHLLEKLNVKNSMELIRRAFRLFWN